MPDGLRKPSLDLDPGRCYDTRHGIFIWAILSHRDDVPVLDLNLYQSPHPPSFSLKFFRIH